MGIVANPFFTTGVTDGRDVPTFGYANILETGTVTVTDEATGYEKENLWSGFVNDWWQGDSGPGTYYITVDAGSSVGVNYFGCYGHNLGSVGGSVQLQSSSNNVDWVNESNAYAPTSTEPFLVATGYDTFRNWRLKVITSTAVPKIGYAAIGVRLDLPSGLRTGFAVPNIGPKLRQVSNDNNDSVLLGCSTYADPVEFNITSELYSLTWIKTYWVPFIRHLELGKPALFAWSANNYAGDVVFCRATELEIPVFERTAYLTINQKFKGYFI